MPKYTRLDPAAPEIRLLELLPGQGSAPVHCKLLAVGLSTAPAFEALSYVWGDAKITAPIVVDGDTFQDTTNLETALRALRRRRGPRLMWVDAVCINQDDVQEKNVQVLLMNKLYSGAAAIVVWLGMPTSNMEFAVSWAQTYVQEHDTDMSTSWSKHTETIQALDGLLDIFSHPYWERIWTFQEYRLAKEEPACMCGELEFRATALVEQMGAARDATFDIF